MGMRKTRFATAHNDITLLRRDDLNKLQKESFFGEYNFIPEPGMLYFTTRAISARVNRNYDAFPSIELKKAHKTFVGRPYFVNHVNMDHKRTRGIIVGSIYKENGADKYIELLIECDAKAFPHLAREIANGNLDGVSMGVDVQQTKCSACGNVANAPEDFCDHILYMKGQHIANDQGQNVLVYETCYGLNFFEISSVFDPADETALVQEVLMPRMANTKEAFGEPTAPPQVDTLRQETPCPNCGSDDFNGETCQWCGFNNPPDELRDPDLDQAKQVDRQQDQVEQGGNNMGDLNQNPDMVGDDQGLDNEPIDQQVEEDLGTVNEQLADISDAIDKIEEAVGVPNDEPMADENPVDGQEENPVADDNQPSQDPDQFKQSKREPTLSNKKKADLSRNVAPNNGEEAAADTPPAEGATSSTDKERNGEDYRTNVQDLDSNPATEDALRGEAERQNVVVPTKAVAKVSRVKLGQKELNMIFARCDGHYANLDLGTAIAKASHDYAQYRKVSAKSVLLQTLLTAHSRRNELNEADRKSLITLGNSFLKRLKAEGTDILDLMDNKENLDVAKPTDRVDVEAPVGNDTNDYAQASQFDADKYDNNQGTPLAKPDDVHTMNWAPGEDPNQPTSAPTNKTSALQKASAVDAIKLAEAYIELGVISPDLKFDKIAEFENLPKVYVQQQQFALDAVTRASASRKVASKPRGVVPQAANGHRPVPQMGRAATVKDSVASVDDDVFMAL